MRFRGLSALNSSVLLYCFQRLRPPSPAICTNPTTTTTAPVWKCLKPGLSVLDCWEHQPQNFRWHDDRDIRSRAPSIDKGRVCTVYSPPPICALNRECRAWRRSDVRTLSRLHHTFLCLWLMARQNGVLHSRLLDIRHISQNEFHVHNCLIWESGCVSWLLGF